MHKNKNPLAIVGAGKTAIKHGGTIVLSAETGNKKESTKKDPALLMTKIIKQQRTLYAKEMADFIAARALAENPDFPLRTLLYDIYANVMDDPFVHGQVENQRILPVKNKDFKVKNAKGDIDPDKTKCLQKGWFSELVKHALESKFWGFSLVYLQELTLIGGTAFITKVKLLERKNVHPERHVVTRYQSDLSGDDYTSTPISNYVIPIGEDDDLGLLLKAVPMYIFKKHGWQNWDEFSEMFGMPIRTVKTASQDPRVLGEIEGWLQDMSTASYGIFPDGTELDIKVSNQTDAFKVFAEAINMAKEELAILFNGQTMTSMNGSSRSQGEVHERTKDEITKDDEKFVKIFVTEQLIPFLRDVHKYPFDIGDEFEWDQPEDLEALLKIFQGVNNMGFQLDPDQVSEKLGVKILGIKAGSAETKDPKEEIKDPEDEPGDKDLSATEILKLHAQLQKEMFGGVA